VSHTKESSCLVSSFRRKEPVGIPPLRGHKSHLWRREVAGDRTCGGKLQLLPPSCCCNFCQQAQAHHADPRLTEHGRGTCRRARSFRSQKQNVFKKDLQSRFWSRACCVHDYTQCSSVTVSWFTACTSRHPCVTSSRVLCLRRHSLHTLALKQGWSPNLTQLSGISFRDAKVKHVLAYDVSLTVPTLLVSRVLCPCRHSLRMLALSKGGVPT